MCDKPDYIICMLLLDPQLFLTYQYSEQMIYFVGLNRIHIYLLFLSATEVHKWIYCSGRVESEYIIS